MLVALAVVAHGGPVDRLLEGRQVDGFLAERLGGAGAGLERGERAPGVTGPHPQQVLHRLVVERHAAAQAALVDQRPLDQLPDRVVVERLQGEQQRAREQRRDDGEERVLGRRADEGDQTGLDPGEQRVLLALVEPVHLVDEEHGALAVHGEPVLGLVDRLPDVLHA